MFQIHKKPQGDAAVKKSVLKILDHKKDLATRLKHLKLVLELVTDQAEIQNIFEQYYSHIYYVFFENFLLAEANVRQKGAHRSQREELDSILQIFETILIRLPDLVHEGWQYNSIDHIIKKLIHPGNSLKIRRDGIRLFLLWFRALRDKARSTTVLLYASLVPGFPSPPTNNERYSGCTLESLLNPVPESQSGMAPAEVTSLVPPPAGEKTPPDLTKYFLDALLEYMVVEACKLQWKDGRSVDTLSFAFLWDMFKKFYLPHIFHDFHFDTSVYQPDLSLPEPREPVNYILNVTDTGTIDPFIEVAAGCPMLPARVSTIKWVVAFTSNALRNESKTKPGRSDIVLDGLSRLMQKHMQQQRQIVASVIGLPDKISGPEVEVRTSSVGSGTGSTSAQQEGEASHSNASTLTEKAPSLSSLSSLDDKLKSHSAASDEEELVRNILYSTRQNVNIVHEIFRQALMLPLTEATTMRRVIKVYQEWIQDGVLPVFMEESDLNASSNQILDEDQVSGDDDDTGTPKDAHRKKSTASTTSLRNTSYMRGQLNPLMDEALSANVRTGCQTTFQLFVTNAAHVFLVEPPTDASRLIQAQVDVCKRVLNLYRHMVMHVSMDTTTWTQLLQVLLHITRIMLQDTDIPTSIRAATVAGRLAGPVFQTLIVSWIKANLFVHVTRELWDELVDVLSSLMQWKDLIVEWARNMDTMTRVLARHVYGLELSDLPLDRLTEQKQKKNRKAALRERLGKSQERSFSKGWSRESIPPHSAKSQSRMRSRSAVGSVQASAANSADVKGVSVATSGRYRNRSPEVLQRSSSRGRSVTVLGIEPVAKNDPEFGDTSVVGELQDHGNHMPLKRGRSDNSSLSMSPTGLGLPDAFPGKPENLQRSSSTSDIACEKGDEIFPCEGEDDYSQSVRHRANSGPGFRGTEENAEDTVHGLKIPKEDDDGITSLSSVEDTFNDMFDELIQQRLSTVNPKPLLAEAKQPDVVSVKSQDSGSIDPNWNPWAESDSQSKDSAPDGSDTNQPPLFSENEEKSTAQYSDLKEEEDWQTCLEDASFGEENESEEHSSVPTDSSASSDDDYDFSSTTDTSSEATSPGMSSPPYQIYKDAARDRYDSTALLLPETKTSNSEADNRESIAEEDEGDNDSPDAILEKSSDDILGVHTSTSSALEGRRGSTGASDAHSVDESADGSTHQDKTDSILAPAEDCSILAGGRRTGWYPDVAVALWRRLLGILGDINTVKDPVIHQLIFTYLLKFWDVLLKMRENLGITTDNASTPPPPELVPPLHIMAPWAFKAIMSLPETHKGGRLHAYQLLCNTTLQHHDTRLEPEHLALFYMVLHEGLHADQDTVNEIVESSCPKFFSSCLPASTLLLLDFIYGCHAVAASTDLSGPRVEAQTILGSVLCFPNLYYDLPVLNPDSPEPQVILCNNIKEYVADALLTSAKKEPSAPARCVALSSLGVWLYEELTSPAEENGTTPSPVPAEGFAYAETDLSPVKGRMLARHGRVKEAINVLLVSLKFNNRMVAGVACSQLHLLIHCIPQLLEYMPEMPARIIEVMSLTASSLLQNYDTKSSPSGRQLLVSLLLCICDWCMSIPLTMLAETTAPGSDKRLIRTVFKALQTGALGKPGHSAKHSYSLSDLASKDFDPNLQIDKVQEWGQENGSSSVLGRNNKLALPPMPSVTLGTDNVVSLTASTVLSHLTNLLGHFPLAKGPAVLNSMVTEQQDHGSYEKNSSVDLSNELFNSPNVQFLIYNDTCLLSVVEISAQSDVPGGGPTAGLSTAPSDVRVIIRDTSGKFCWDSSILYGAPDIQAAMTPVRCSPLSTLDAEIAKFITEHCDSYLSYAEAELARRQRVNNTPIPSHTTTLPVEQANDKLDQLLQYIGWSSPECQEIPGRPLNIPASVPVALEDSRLQVKAEEFIRKQHKTQSVSYSGHAHHTSCQSRPARPPAYSDPQSAFHQSRLLITECGFLSRENRRRISLLKKNERLLRELKNLDSRHCRETHKVAVLYIAPGQEDKLSVLSNTAGSEEFENFVSGLGWEIDLKTHCGFRGKLHSDGSTGETAPYYSTSTLEVVFHVSTRFPSTNEDSRNMKLKHLGNDEVHIVWSEHSRDYRRGIIPTEFGDVLIVIYPIRHRLYRIQIKKKEEVPYFGPLFDGAIVNARVLPVLVRETAINAGRAKRSQISLYQPFYEERAKYLRQIIDQFKEETTFEDYAGQLFSPTLGRSPSVKVHSKRPAPKPTPAPVNDAPPTPSSGSSTPSPIVGKVLPLSQHALLANGNNNNNSDATEGHKYEHSARNTAVNGPDGPAHHTPVAHKEYSMEKFEGAKYTPGLQVVKEGVDVHPANPVPPATTSRLPTITGLISTPRPKPSAPPAPLSALHFSQPAQGYASTHLSSPRIHIPISKIQPSSPKATGNTSSFMFARKTSTGSIKSNASSTGVILVPPPTGARPSQGSGRPLSGSFTTTGNDASFRNASR